jgi:four helix bundle protein
MAGAEFEFENLVVYQKALDFVGVVYRAVRHFPGEERYVLSSQFRRAAMSICLNIAEGSGGSPASFRHFVGIAYQSVRECVAITEIATRAAYFNAEQREYLRDRLEELARMLSGLHRSLEQGKAQEEQDGAPS